MPDAPDGFRALDDPGPFAELIGPLYLRHSSDDTTLGLHVETRHANAAGAVHGGLLATLCDSALGHAIRAKAQDDISGAVTVSLTTDYLAPAKPGTWLEATTKLEKLGGRLAFANCSVTSDGQEVVRARAVFSVLD